MEKRKLGQFFTKKGVWLKPQVEEFIKAANPKIAFDPFAGNGDLLKVALKIGIKQVKGFDIDKNLKWDINDSLVNIPKVNNSVIITNPPYLANYSARRIGIINGLEKYFEQSNYSDLYQIALEKCLENNEYVVAIIPETFLKSSFPKERLKTLTILEENPFSDTDCPVCIACFNNKINDSAEVMIYKDEELVCTLEYLKSLKRRPSREYKIEFNNLSGKLALRAIDMKVHSKKIEFMKLNDLKYNLKGIKNSSRLITIIDIKDIPEEKLDDVIRGSNEILLELRNKSCDLLLSPFKGNDNRGKRRRRLDYLTARAILEEACKKAVGESQACLFNE